MNRLIRRQHVCPVFFVALLVACVGVFHTARAVIPPPDGGYAGFNTGEGTDALFSNTTGQRNTGLGFQALYYNNGNVNTAEGFRALFSNTSGTQNTATGAAALLMNTTGFDNTATGFSALRNNTTGSGNTATGANALQNDTYGIENSAFGKHALFFNNVGSHNTAVGFEALDRNVTGDDNTAAGAGALRGNSTGFENTANGAGALYRNTTGISNTATGASALFYNIADYNTANGDEALFSNTTGIFNTACGWFALHTNTTGSGNTATGSGALRENRTGSSNIALGNGAGSNLTAGDDNIYVGSVGPSSFGSEANTIRIGNEAVQAATYIAGINGRTASGGVAVYVNTDGKLGTAPSSARFKDEIRPMVSASEAILALKPVTFRYKAEIDPKGIPQFGLVAEEVEKVNPALIVRDKEGKPYSVRYEQINAMLLNEFLKEHRKVQELEANAVRQQKQIETLTAGLRKVSAQLELNQPVPQTVCLPAIVLREGENDR